MNVPPVPRYWILGDDGEPAVADDVLAWGQWFETHDRHVLDERVGRVRISTVFLGLNHDWREVGPPVLWETMIFGGVFDGYQLRYRSRLDALRGHLDAVHQVELYRAAPRRIKKSVRKYRLATGLDTPVRHTHGDAVRVARFVRRHMRLTERNADAEP